jgi:hypothetical protein
MSKRIVDKELQGCKIKQHATRNIDSDSERLKHAQGHAGYVVKDINKTSLSFI